MKRFLAILILLLSAGAVRADITSNLVAHWKLDETSGTSAADSAGSYTGTYTNSPTLNQTGAFGSSKAVTFASASSQYVNTTYNLGLLTGNWTIGFWAKPTALANMAPFGQASGGNNTVLAFAYGGSYAFRWCVGGFSEGTNALTSTSAFANGIWKHCVATWDGTTLTLYANGVQNIADSSMTVTMSGTAAVARRASGEYWNGTIDDVRIYNRALSAADVATLYAYTGARFPYWYFHSSGCDPFKVFRTRQPLAIVTTR